MIASRSAIALIVLSIVVAGCGDEPAETKTAAVSAKDRVGSCLTQYPSSTESDCQGWEKDGKLDDDGTHTGHESMGG